MENENKPEEASRSAAAGSDIDALAKEIAALAMQEQREIHGEFADEEKLRRGASAKLTAADRKAFELLPRGGWFEIHQVNYMVRSPRWRCDRLTDFGLLERRVESRPMNVAGLAGARHYVTQFRISPNEKVSRRDAVGE